MNMLFLASLDSHRVQKTVIVFFFIEYFCRISNWFAFVLFLFLLNSKFPILFFFFSVIISPWLNDFVVISTHENNPIFCGDIEIYF